MSTEEKAKIAFDNMSNFINSISPSFKEFIELESREHRTLQQTFTSLCLHWLKFLSEQPDYYFDLRNEASGKVARKVSQALKQYEDDNAWAYLPSI